MSNPLEELLRMVGHERSVSLPWSVEHPSDPDVQRVWNESDDPSSMLQLATYVMDANVLIPAFSACARLAIPLATPEDAVRLRRLLDLVGALREGRVRARVVARERDALLRSDADENVRSLGFNVADFVVWPREFIAAHVAKNVVWTVLALAGAARADETRVALAAVVRAHVPLFDLATLIRRVRADDHA